MIGMIMGEQHGIEMLDLGIQQLLAQVWRGGPQAGLSRLLAGCQVEALTETASRATGAACARSRRSDVVDASVVVGALRRDDVVFTSDVADLAAIAGALGKRLVLHRV